MTLDEKSLSDALRAIDSGVSPDLAARVRIGGRRRLVRRRSLTAVGAVAIGAVATPTAIAARAVGPHGGGTFKVGSSPNATDPALYAAPPAIGSECNGGYSGKDSPAAHPDLLLLPPQSADVRYAFVRNQTSACAAPHVALTAIQQHGDAIGAGLVVEGPNAPTATEDGRVGPYIDFMGETGHAPIDGQPAVEFTIQQSGHTDAYWTEPDGGQWHAVVRDMNQADAVALLDRLELDGHDGTATLPDASNDGWTVEGPVADRSADQGGTVISQWTDTQGHLVDMTVSQTSDRTIVDAIAGGGSESIVTVRGKPAVLSPTGGNGGDGYGLIWQEDKDVLVSLSVTGGNATEIEQVAESLSLASPDDARFGLQGG